MHKYTAQFKTDKHKQQSSELYNSLHSKSCKHCVVTNSNGSLCPTNKTVSGAGDSLPSCELAINSTLLHLPVSHPHWTWANISMLYVFRTSYIHTIKVYFTCCINIERPLFSDIKMSPDATT